MPYFPWAICLTKEEEDNKRMKWWIKIIIGALLPIGVGVAIIIPFYLWIILEGKPPDPVQYQIGFEYGKKNATEHIKQLRTEQMSICPIPAIDNISFCMRYADGYNALWDAIGEITEKGTSAKDCL
jgi:hypothetical protein